jgi:hypothetical protein
VSRDALASVYADILENDYFRRTVAEHPEVLGDFELTDDEKKALSGEAGQKAEEIDEGAPQRPDPFPWRGVPSRSRAQ